MRIKHLSQYIKVSIALLLAILLVLEHFVYQSLLETHKHQLREIEEYIPKSTIPLVVYISGAVNAPGVYEVKEGSRIAELLDKAKGITSSVAMLSFQKDINLAAKVVDGQHIFIPAQNSELNNKSQSNLLTNINTASLSELVALPEIGEATAKAIIEHRPYSVTEDLLDVEGVGDKTFDAIKTLITI